MHRVFACVKETKIITSSPLFLLCEQEKFILKIDQGRIFFFFLKRNEFTEIVFEK